MPHGLSLRRFRCGFKVDFSLREQARFVVAHSRGSRAILARSETHPVQSENLNSDPAQGSGLQSAWPRDNRPIHLRALPCREVEIGEAAITGIAAFFVACCTANLARD
jgi:hypothetical protein